MKTILFVHDSQSSPAPRQHYLEVSGFRVISLKSAHEAVRAIGQNRPDMLLTDVLVEGMNGFELCAEVRKQHDAATLPVVMFSGIYKGRAFVEEARNVGAQAFLAAPTNLDEMIRTINDLFAAAEQGDGAQGAASGRKAG
ncbi:MAG: response regulator [Planctomycetota bacterium]